MLNGFRLKPKVNWDTLDKKLFSLNIRAMQTLRSALSDDIYVKISKCSNAKEIWDTLNALYLANNNFLNKDVYEKQEEQKQWKESNLGKCTQ